MKLKCGIPEKEYSIIHTWLRRKIGPATKCENPECSGKSKKYQHALIKGKKYEKNISNFMTLCVSCHLKYDWDESNRTSMRVMSEERKRKIGAAQIGRKWDDKRREEQSKRFSGSGNPFYGKSLKGSDSAWFGKFHTNDAKIKMLNNKANITKEQVIEIKSLWGDGIEQKEIAKRFNISRASVCRIINNKRYILW